MPNSFLCTATPYVIPFPPSKVNCFGSLPFVENQTFPSIVYAALPFFKSNSRFSAPSLRLQIGVACFVSML